MFMSPVFTEKDFCFINDNQFYIKLCDQRNFKHSLQSLCQNVLMGRKCHQNDLHGALKMELLLSEVYLNQSHL